MTTITDAVRVLAAHPEVQGQAPHNEDTAWTCTGCGAPMFGDVETALRAHQADALMAAGLLRPDLERDFGLSKVEIDQRWGGPTHVRIERGGVPIVDGYIAQPQAALRRAHRMSPRIEPMRPGCYPGQTLQERLLALADDMGDTPFTAAIVRQFAAEAALMVPIQRPERHGTDTAWVSDPYRLDDAGPVWTPIVQQYAARELRVRELTEAVWRESQADETVIHDAGIMQDIVLRLRDALDPTTTTDEDPST